VVLLFFVAAIVCTPTSFLRTFGLLPLASVLTDRPSLPEECLVGRSGCFAVVLYCTSRCLVATVVHCQAMKQSWAGLPEVVHFPL